MCVRVREREGEETGRGPWSALEMLEGNAMSQGEAYALLHCTVKCFCAASQHARALMAESNEDEARSGGGKGREGEDRGNLTEKSIASRGCLVVRQKVSEDGRAACGCADL